MAAQWLLFYAMIGANFGGGGYALVRGHAAHRWASAVFVGGIALQLTLLQIAAAQGASRVSVAVTTDTIANSVMCLGFLSIAICYERGRWVIGLLLLQAAQLCLDGFVFDDDPMTTRLEFPAAANVITILEMTWLGAAVWWARRRDAPLAATAVA